MTDLLELWVWIPFAVFIFFFVVISFLYWLESERDNEEIKRQEKQVADDYKEFLRTGNDYHFLDKERQQ
jgi:hypothetical protein